MTTPYTITQVTAVTYSGRHIPLPIKVDGIHQEPLRVVEERIFQHLKNAHQHDPFVKLHLKTRPI